MLMLRKPVRIGSSLLALTTCLALAVETGAGIIAPEVARGDPLARRPFASVSADRMLASLGELVSFGQDSFFRTWGSRGEREAFDWLEQRLAELPFLERIGAEIRRKTFRIPFASDVRTCTLTLTVGGQDFQVPVHAIHGHRDDLALALRFDSDGQPNDDDPDPVMVDGGARLVRGSSALASLGPGSLRGTVAFADGALVDRGVLPNATAAAAAATLLTAAPSALVVVSQYSNTPGVAHGSFLGDLSAFVGLASPAPVPTVFVRIEDLASAGILDWNGLARVSRARLVWDVDLVTPGESQYLAFHIPGRDGSRAVLLGAHVDSANSPGAMDDGSGVVALLEAARALDHGRITPPVDVALLFFGSEERGLYGSSAFALDSSELLDRAMAMLQIDCLTHPLDGLAGQLVLESQSYRPFGDSRLPFSEALRQSAGRQGVALSVLEFTGASSDNSSFDGLGVPNANTVFLDTRMAQVHVDGHLHDPYDDMALVALHREELAGLARTALSAIVDLPAAPGPLRVTPPPVSRAVFVASHTEAVHMTPAHQSMLGMQLSWEGWDVDVVPYGTPVTAADLAGAGLVVVLPVLDYALPASGGPAHDEGFSGAEVDALTRYVEDGGLLVLTASARRLRYNTTPFEENEDWAGMNALGERFGIAFEDRRLQGPEARTVGSHPLIQGVAALTLVSGNGLAIRASGAQAQLLARVGNDTAAALVPVGTRGGQVLALSDAAMLGGRAPDAPKLAFFRNLARYGGSR